MNLVDLVIVLLMIVSAVRGVDIGFVRQFGSLVGLWLGLIIGGWLVSLFSTHSTGAVLIILASVAFGVICGEMIGIKLKLLLNEHKINVLDRIFGAAMGVLTCLVAVWLGSTIITVVSSPGLQRAVRDSTIINYLDRTLPPATDAISSLESYLKNAGIADVIKTLEPKPSNNTTQLPTLASLNQVIVQSKESVVEIEGRSCTGISVGSGFITEDGLVVTNAHVVAGMRKPFVKDADGRHLSEVIGFDPDLDIAVLRTDGLSGPELTLASKLSPKNIPGAVMGYPGGGGLTTTPAILTDIITVLSKDIYEQASSNRQIYALRADIQKGNSGGPLIDKNGQVIGVIFARSTTYPQVGYALTSPDVLAVVSSAQNNPNNGESLRCLE